MRLERPCRAPRATAWVGVSVSGVPEAWKPYLPSRPEPASWPARSGVGTTGPAAALHARDPRSGNADDLGGSTSTVAGARARIEPADDVVDSRACARAGVDVVRRRSGGGAVLLVPGPVVWFDVIVPPVGARCWRPDDVRGVDVWLGALVAANARDCLAGLTDRLTVHDGRDGPTPWSATVCFAGLGPGEVCSTAASSSASASGARGRRPLPGAWHRRRPGALPALLLRRIPPPARGAPAGRRHLDARRRPPSPTLPAALLRAEDVSSRGSRRARRPTPRCGAHRWSAPCCGDVRPPRSVQVADRRDACGGRAARAAREPTRFSVGEWGRWLTKGGRGKNGDSGATPRASRRGRRPREPERRRIEGRGNVFVGEHDRSSTSNGGSALPSAFRDELGEHCYVTLGADGCVTVLGRRVLPGPGRRCSNRSGAASSSRDRNGLRASAVPCGDRQAGPDHPRRAARGHAGINSGGQVMVARALDWLEIWRPDAYRRATRPAHPRPGRVRQDED